MDLEESKLPFTLHDRIVKFLASLPNIEDSNARLALLYGAGLDEDLRQNINLANSSVQFFHLLVPMLDKYGKLKDGRNALTAILESARNYVGQEGREYCDDLINELRSLLTKRVKQLNKHRNKIEESKDSMQAVHSTIESTMKRIGYIAISIIIILIFVFNYRTNFISLLTTLNNREKSNTSSEAIWKEPITGMEFVWVPGGCYEMGQSEKEKEELIAEVGIQMYNIFHANEVPKHRVCVDSFWIGKYEVTQEQWSKIMGTFELPETPVINLKASGGEVSDFQKGGDYPVAMVFWEQAQEFIQKLSVIDKGQYKFRLPTEAEWEYACKSGGKPQKYAGGDDIDQVAWYKGNSSNSIHVVGTKAPNEFGIFDMSGNVWEWIVDICDDDAYTKHERNNPIHISDGACLGGRGGSWQLEKHFLRCTSRWGSDGGWAGVGSGFRVVRIP